MNVNLLLTNRQSNWRSSNTINSYY